MPDRRHHRGPHPGDERAFAPEQIPKLRTALTEYDWLLDRGYAPRAALELVGNHHQLGRRQRLALLRSGAGLVRARARKEKVVPVSGLAVAVDGFNVLLTIEAALSGGILLRGHDRFPRDLSSVHGSYRTVDETALALDLVVGALVGAARIQWFLDRPVSNSGRVAALLRERAQHVELVPSADAALLLTGDAMATADGPLLDRAAQAVDLTGAVISSIPSAWIVDLVDGS
jgi:hypothetical protein